MIIDELVKICYEEHKANASKCVCGDCSHPRKCPGNCNDCLNEVHLTRSEGERADYNCPYLLYYYVGKYIYAYTSEMEYALNTIRDTLENFKYMHILSIGCGPAPDLFAINQFQSSNGFDQVLSYIGFDHNAYWGEIHEIIKCLLPNNKKSKIQFKQLDAIDFFQKKELKQCNMLIMQYLLSHIVYNQRQDEIESFFDSLIINVILKMDNHSFIIINDINHNLARDYIDIFIKKIRLAGKRTKKLHFYFEYKDEMGYYQTRGKKHKANDIKYSVEPKYSNYFDTRLDCRSEQYIIEVYD